MRRTKLCLWLGAGVAVGAHPGLPDLAGFGRRNLAVSAEEVSVLIGVGIPLTRSKRVRNVDPVGLEQSSVRRYAIRQDAVGAFCQKPRLRRLCQVLMNDHWINPANGSGHALLSNDSLLPRGSARAPRSGAAQRWCLSSTIAGIELLCWKSTRSFPAIAEPNVTV